MPLELRRPGRAGPSRAAPCAASARRAPGAAGRRGELGAAPDVVGPAAVVRVHAAVLERERPVGDRVEQRAVVRDEQDRAGERLERLLERLAALEVEVVRRLVEDEEVRAGRDDDREREPAPLAAGERGDGPLVHVPAGEEELAEQRLRLAAGEPGRARGGVEHAAAARQLDLVLREVRGLDAVAEPDRLRPAARAARRASRSASSCRSRSGRRARRARRARARTRRARRAPCRRRRA